MEVVIGQTKNFAQYPDNFVTGVRIGHDCEERRRPGVCRAFSFPIGFRVNFHRQMNIDQRVAQRPQPRFARTQNRHLAP